MSNRSIKVYWSPFPFGEMDQQWNMAYREPVPVADNFYSNLNDEAMIVRCPVARDSVKNLFSINSNIEDVITFDPDLISSLILDQSQSTQYLPIESKISLMRNRPSSYDGFVNINYNLSWLFLADEPVVMRTLPPIFPVSTPVPNSILAFGKFDVGRWFRPITLDYHIPSDSKSFVVKNNQPLIFLEFETDKKIEFVRFKNTQTIRNLSDEFSESPNRWGKRMSMEQRYKMAEKSKLIDLVMFEIKNNLVQI